MTSKTNNKPTWQGNVGQTYPLPPGFKCKLGGEWRPYTRFSKNQLAIWHNRKRSPNDGVTAENIGLVCRDHTGEPALTLKCNGPCGLWKARDKFSNNNRRNKFRWCESCVRWRAQQDYDAVPIAAPNEANEALDEEEGFTAQQEGQNYFQDDNQVNTLERGPAEIDGESANVPNNGGDDLLLTDSEDEGGLQASVAGHGHYFGEESSDESDDDHITIAKCAPAIDISTPMSNVKISTSQPGKAGLVKSVAKPDQAAWQASRGLSASTFQGTTNSSGPVSTQSTWVDVQSSVAARSTQISTSSWMPPHLMTNENQVTLRERNLIERHMPSSARSVNSGSTTAVAVPPHLRADTSSPSMMSGNCRAGVPTMSTGSRMPSAWQGLQAPRAQQFTAFDADGNAHARYAGGANTGTDTSIAGVTTSVVNRKKQHKGNFARPDQRKIFDSLWVPENRSGKDHVDTYNSGSDDEM